MKKILLTGAAGHIGTSLRILLGRKYHFRCLDILPIEGEEDQVTADIMDFDAVLKATQGMDAVIHLAGNLHPDQSWEDVYGPGIGGTYNVFEAASQAGVKKVIYASSTLVLGWKEMLEGKCVSLDMPVQPYKLYGAGKTMGEILARYFSEVCQMSVICLRIGSFFVHPPYPQNPDDYILKAWVSPEDLAQMVQRSLEAEGLGFNVFYAVSDNTQRLWPLSNARKLIGYQPTSNAEHILRGSTERTKKLQLSKEHLLLTRAAVLADQRAIDSWLQWLEMVDLEGILDTRTYRLLPMVYNNLVALKLEHPMMPKLKGVYRRTWLENQLSLKKLIPFITQLKGSGIPIVFLDDLTSILCLYDGQGMRRPFSMDFLIRPEDGPKLLDLFRIWKIWPKKQLARRLFPIEPHLELWPPFDLPLSVTWRVFPTSGTPAQALTAWPSGKNVRMGDLQVATLDLESHFLRSCLKALGDRPESAFFSLVDIAWMLKEDSPNMDWERVVELARTHHLALPLHEALKQVAEIADSPRLNNLMLKAHRLPVTWMDRQVHRFTYVYQPFPNRFFKAIRRVLLYMRSPKIKGILGPVRYLQIVWGGFRIRTRAREFLSKVGFRLKKQARDDLP